MNCNEFELLLADALGGELAPADRPGFERHLADCVTCRRDYETTVATVARLRSLPMVDAGSVKPMAARRVIRPSPLHRRTALLRYAASILLAFIAGYSVSSLRTESSSRPGVVEVGPSFNPTDETRLAATSFGAAFVETYQDRPGGTELSRCLTAMFGKRK